jgi:TolB protein
VDARRSGWLSSAALPDLVVAVPDRKGKGPPFFLPAVGSGLTRARLRVALMLVLGLALGGCGLVGLGGKPAESRPPPPSRLAYTAEDGHVYVMPLAGGDARRVSQIAGQVPGETVGREAPVPRWPTWSPDASRLAFTRILISSGEDLLASQLWTIGFDGSDLRKIWEAPDQEPIYFAWSPDGSLIAMLVQTDEDLDLVLVDASGSQPPRRVAQGNPFYFAWAPDSKALLLHIGSTAGGASQPELAVARLGPPDEVRSLGVAPGDFRTPGWTSDGRKLAFVASGPDGVSTISLVSPEGGDITRVATATGQTAFVLHPDGGRLAWSSRNEQGRQTYDGLEVVTSDGRKRTRVTNDQVLAFYWSPDGRQLAFVTLDEGSQAFAWQVADADGNNARRLSTFTPTALQFRVLAFFDQYAISHGTWAPDSSAVVYAIGLPGEQRGFGREGPGTIQAASTEPNTRPHTVIGGTSVALPVPAP